MNALTDPAREYAELCEALYVHSTTAGDAFLADKFEVPAWSSEYYQIVFCIIERADRLIELVKELDLDADFATEAAAHVVQTKQAFTRNAFTHSWNQIGYVHLAPVNIQPLKMLSPLIRSKVSYPKLTSDDAIQLQNAVAEFLTWLTEHQLAEQDFVRQALVDGLRQFSFRLSKTRWLGWGYTIHSLREVIAAYKLLEGATPPNSSAPDAEAILKKGARFFTRVFEIVGVAKDTTERADFLLKAYGAISLIQHGTTVAGLLTHLNG